MAITDLNLTNVAKSLLVGSINNVDDPATFSMTPGDGNLKFPSTAGGKYFKLFVIKPDKTFEIMKVTSRTNDSLTAVRAQEGTSKLAFTAGAALSVRLTAQDILDIIAAQAASMPSSGGAFTGSVSFQVGADVASASALAIDIPGNIFDITGTATINTMNTKGVGSIVVFQFDGAARLFHHATDLVLPGGLHITTAAGDVAVFYEYLAGKWRLISYTYAASPPATQKDAKFQSFVQNQSLSGAAPITLGATGLSGEGYYEVDLILNGVKLSGTDDLLIQFRRQGGWQTASYVSRSATVNNGVLPTNNFSGNGFRANIGGSGNSLSGLIVFKRAIAAAIPGGDVWAASGELTLTGIGASVSVSGIVDFDTASPTSVLDGIRLGVTGSNTFVSGEASVVGKR
ncbi:MAG: hypothetical protein K2Y51_25960 [Gammaproteobacteria bacterium]|nr:hypothetical protein [Gammaproteobacteria bacterium]